MLNLFIFNFPFVCFLAFFDLSLEKSISGRSLVYARQVADCYAENAFTALNRPLANTSELNRSNVRSGEAGPLSDWVESLGRNPCNRVRLSCLSLR